MNRDRKKIGRIWGIEMTGNQKREENGQQGRELESGVLFNVGVFLGRVLLLPTPGSTVPVNIF